MQRALRNRFLSSVVCALTLALVLSSAASAQDWVGRGRLSGSVTGPDGKALPDVKVTLLKNGVEGQGPEPFTTDKKGRWGYLGLSGGNWKVILDAEGLMTSEGQVRVSEFGAGQKLPIQMKEIPKEVVEESAADRRRDLLNQGNAALAEGKFAEARAAYEEVMGEIEESQHPQLLRGIARTYYEEKNVDQAVATLEKALALVPDDSETLKLAINLLVASGRESEAQAYMARLPEGAGVDANTVLNMGIQRYNEDDFEGSLEFFERAAQENPDMPEVFYFRGLAHLGMGNSEPALADFKKVVELDSTYKPDEVQPFIEYLESQVQESQE